MAKEGSTIGGLMDSIGTLTSLALQYGVPLEALVRKFAHQRFEPSGFTKNPEIRNASSITDYVFRWMALQFIPGFGGQFAESQPTGAGHARSAGRGEKEDEPSGAGAGHVRRHRHFGSAAQADRQRQRQHAAKPSTAERTVKTLSDSVAHFQQDAPTCPNCGHVTVRNGACYKCLNCGESLGCS